MGRVPANGYFARLASLSSNPRPGFCASGKRPSTIRMAGNPSHSSHTLSVAPGWIWPQISCTTKFVIAEFTCNVANPPMGPSQAWGAMEIPDAAAICETFQSPVMPPYVIDIGLENVDYAHLDQISRTPKMPTSRSPVAMGVVERRAILAMAWTFSGGHGSSMKSRFSGSTSFTRIEATLGLVLA